MLGSVTSGPAVVTVLPVAAVSDAMGGYLECREGTGTLLIEIQAKNGQ